MVAKKRAKTGLKRSAKKAPATHAKKSSKKSVRKAARKGVKPAVRKRVKTPVRKVAKKQAKRIPKKRVGTTRKTIAMAAAAISYRALCRKGDYEGPACATRSEARADGSKHSAATGHTVSVIAEQS